MSDSFGSDSSVKVLGLVAQYKKLLARREQLSPNEQENLKLLESKLASILHPKETKENLDRRQALRVKANIAVNFKTLGDFKKAYIKNISGGGLYINTSDLRPIGTSMTLSLQLPESSEPVTIEGEVSWVNPKNIGGLERGVGIKFKNLTYDLQKKIDKLVEASLEKELKDLGAKKK